MSVTIKQIAQQSGLSLQTVSKVLKDGGVAYRPQTRDLVLRVAEELGYRPNSSARAMRTGRSGCVALLLSTKPYHSNLFPGMLDGIHDALAARDLHLTLTRLPDETLTDPAFIPKILRELLADGLLINYTHDVPAHLMGLIEHHKVPAIWINTDRPWDTVRPDDFAAGQTATEYLIERGHRRIAFLQMIPAAHYSVTARRAGYELAMRNAALPRSVPEAEAVATVEERIAHAAHWLSGPERPTAAIVYLGWTAFMVNRAAMALGLRVPGDLSIVTFDGRPVEDIGSTPLEVRTLTTFLTPERAMGEAAVALLQEKMARPGVPLPPRIIPFGFFEGTSCAPPPV